MFLNYQARRKFSFLVLTCLVSSRYKIGSDPAGWLSVAPDTGVIKVKSLMDRESPLLKDGKYRATILALDNDGNLCFFFKRMIPAGLFLMSVLVFRCCSSNWHRNPGY